MLVQLAANEGLEFIEDASVVFTKATAPFCLIIRADGSLTDLAKRTSPRFMAASCKGSTSLGGM